MQLSQDDCLTWPVGVFANRFDVHDAKNQPDSRLQRNARPSGEVHFVVKLRVCPLAKMPVIVLSLAQKPVHLPAGEPINRGFKSHYEG